MSPRWRTVCVAALATEVELLWRSQSPLTSRRDFGEWHGRGKMLYCRPTGIPIPGMLAIHGQFGNIPLRSITLNGLVKSR